MTTGPESLTISKTDLVLWAAALVGILIVALSVYGLFFSPINDRTFDKDKVAAFHDLFEVVVKGTMVPLFTALITVRIAYSAAQVYLNRIR
jgi:hypothetical protein